MSPSYPNLVILQLAPPAFFLPLRLESRLLAVIDNPWGNSPQAESDALERGQHPPIHDSMYFNEITTLLKPKENSHVQGGIKP